MHTLILTLILSTSHGFSSLDNSHATSTTGQVHSISFSSKEACDSAARKWKDEVVLTVSRKSVNYYVKSAICVEN